MQVIVSRKDASNRIKLSPSNNSRGTNATYSQQVDQFDRVAFNQATERLFDSRFGYEREIKESFKYANTLKHGSYEQKQEVKEQQKQKQTVKIEKQQSHHQGKGLLAPLLDGQSVYAGPAQDDDKKRKRKKKRGCNLDQSQGQSM